MCGLVGYFSDRYFTELLPDLGRATDCLSARGPDGRGIWSDPALGVGMGHRRLAVIDLSSAASQPMQSQDGRFVIVYNGEVYNFSQLRVELEAFGHKFYSRSDTEVILNAYRHWGADCLRRFIGMFAFAILDKKRGKLFLARDRLGIKPLYYYHDHARFIFASELKALMAFKLYPKVIRHSSLRLFLHYQYVPAPDTIFENTYKLLPGHYLAVDIQKQQDLVIEPFWKPSDNTIPRKAAGDFQSAVDKLDELVTKAVATRLVSDVPLGALLSGGIDSSLVTAVMQKVSRRPIRTFSIGFREKGYDEASYARAIARHLGTEHTELYVTPGQALDVIPKLPEIYDEPFADSSAIPTYLVSWLTRQQVTVALTGDGGDEQFAGYVRYWMTNSLVRTGKMLPTTFRSNLGRLLALLSPRRVQRLYDLIRPKLPQRFQVANFPDKWKKLLLVLRQHELAEIYRFTICIWSNSEIKALTGKDLPLCGYESLFHGSGQADPMSVVMRVDRQTYLPDCMLTKVDRASMAASLEVRVPLLDHRVVEFSSSLPTSWLYKNGSGKFILKTLLSRYLPERLFVRPKMGFGVPIALWLRKDLKDMVMDYLGPDRIRKEGLFDYRQVQRVLEDHLRRKGDHHHKIWTLLMWQLWQEKWMD